MSDFFAQLERDTGLCEPYALAKAMGVDLTDPDRERVPSFVLGVADVSPLEMAGAYDAFANGGRRVEPYGVSRIRTPQGRVIYQRSNPEGRQVINNPPLYYLNEMLRGVITSGSGRGTW